MEIPLRERLSPEIYLNNGLSSPGIATKLTIVNVPALSACISTRNLKFIPAA